MVKMPTNLVPVRAEVGIEAGTTRSEGLAGTLREFIDVALAKLMLPSEFSRQHVNELMQLVDYD